MSQLIEADICLKHRDKEVMHEEDRQLGAMLLFHDGRRDIWLMKDKSKLEMAAGLVTPQFVYGTEFRWNVPAGARVGRETVHETLIREFTEEIEGVNLPLNFTIECVSPYYFVTNQVVFDKKGFPSRIDRIAVSVWKAEVDPASEFYEALIGKGRWFPAEEVAEHLGHFDATSAYSDGAYHYRPQLIVAAAMLCGEISRKEVISLNQSVVAIGDSLAKRYGLDINNGAVGSDGRLVEGIESSMTEFLGV